MRILIMGGTQFVGRAMTETALARGHMVTIFHRGQTNPGLFGDQVEEILGDRTSDLSGLSGRNWDAVIDCVGYEPGIVKSTCEAVQTTRYAFVSTVSVYGQRDPDEDSPTPPLPEGASLEGITAENYGPLKVMCEEEIKRVFDQALFIRAGLQIGAWDHTDRFSDWVDRIVHRPRVAVPNDDMPWQLIDALDTATFTLSCLEREVFGTFNVTGESRPMVDVLHDVRDAVAPDTELVLVDPEVAARVAKPWQELTLWGPADQRQNLPFQASIERSKAAGLTLRPLIESAGAIRDALSHLDPLRPRRSGLSVEREAEILAAVE